MNLKYGKLIGSDKVLDAGPAATRRNLVLVGDGYTRKQLTVFARRVAELIEVIKTEEWFERAGHALNVWRVDVASDEPGTWIRYACPYTPRRTAFLAGFCSNKILRAMTGDSPSARALAAEIVGEEADCVGVIVNSTHHGGAGFERGFWTTTRQGWWNTALHELGHGMFGLGDEYDGAGSGKTWNPSWNEPKYPNVTANLNEETLKWRDLLTDHVPVPTLLKKNDRGRNPLTADGVGVFEGAGRMDYGLYRPAYDCRMRSKQVAFCEVCEEHIVRFLTMEGELVPDSPVESGMAPDAPDAPGEPVVVKPVKHSVRVEIDGSRFLYEDAALSVALAKAGLLISTELKDRLLEAREAIEGGP